MQGRGCASRISGPGTHRRAVLVSGAKGVGPRGNRRTTEGRVVTVAAEYRDAWSAEFGTDRVGSLMREILGEEPDGVWSAPGRANGPLDVFCITV